MAPVSQTVHNKAFQQMVVVVKLSKLLMGSWGDRQ